ncbi:AAA family ATPase [Mycolicibacterium sp. 22603]|uniref:AAA family ATPase n=1 Tax=Mycolicibacterium sp. 22603 TaxID=3453950 RepID=UPI003F851CB8
MAVDNWRNFKSLDVPVENRLFVVGPNAAGKSNFLDIFRFMSDIADVGGGLAFAIDRRGGLSKVRSLFARSYQGGRLVLDIELTDGKNDWRYLLKIRGEGSGKNRPVVDQELVIRNGDVLVDRPDPSDKKDPELLTQTHLEQISANHSFREISEYFSKVRYFHLVPQVIRDPSRAGVVVNDPFGGDFIAQMNGVAPRTRDAWMKRMERALKAAVPKFDSLKIDIDSAGRPHLQAGYQHWRSSPAHHTEVEFSDGTLRLIGLLWAVISLPANGGVLLLEEPELSLNSEIVRALPSVLANAQRDKNLQVVLTTHAPELLDDPGVLEEEVLVLQVTNDGTRANLLSDIDEVQDEIEAELPTSEIVHGLIAPQNLEGLVSVASGRRR